MIWHYTVGDNFGSILRERVIRPATLYVPKGERPIVWFTTEPLWEPTVTKAIERPDGWSEALGMTELFAAGQMLGRIGVDMSTAPHRWRELRELSGMTSKAATGLAKSARNRGADPGCWRGTFDPVWSRDWQTIEYFNGEDWTTFDAALKQVREQAA